MGEVYGLWSGAWSGSWGCCLLDVAGIHIEGSRIVLHGLEFAGIVILYLVGMRSNVLQGAQYIVGDLGNMRALRMIAKLIGHIVDTNDIALG